MRRCLLFLILLASILYAEGEVVDTTQDERSSLEQKADRNRKMDNISNGRTYQTYNDETGSEQHTDWNAKDWQKYLYDQNNPENSTGTVQMLFGDSAGASKAFGGNPNAMTSDALQHDEQLKEEPSITAWTQELEAEIAAKSTKNQTTAIKLDATVDCYISRDLPIRYRCEKTNLTYGGGMGENGIKAKTECNNECFEQFACVSLNKNPEVKSEFLNELSIIKNPEDEAANTSTEDEVIISSEVDTTNDVMLDKVKFKLLINKAVETNEDTKNELPTVFVSISYFDKSKQIYIVKKYPFSQSADKTVYLSVYATKFKFEISSSSKNIQTSVGPIELLYVENSKFICPDLQDITSDNGGNFAYVCPSGNVVNFTTGYKNYTICADYGLVGGNKDGTFITRDACESVCKKSFQCYLDMATMNTELLKDFREGCIEGQSNCEKNTCKTLRLSGARILDENVFDGGQLLTQTIIGGSQVEGVKRPRILLNEEIDFQTRNAEEWKDEAFKDMIDNNRFRIATNAIGENTAPSNAFITALRTSEMSGYTKAPSMSGYWRLKPAAFDVNTGVPMKFYTVLETIIERIVFNIEGKKEKVKDKILFVKTSENDTFKPFAIRKNWARNVLLTELDEYGNEVFEQVNAIDESSVWEFKTFNTSTKQWHSHASSLNIEYFKNEPIVMDLPYKRIPLFKEMNKIIYNLPGLVRNITKTGAYETKNYDGNFDGTGETLGKYRVFVFYGENSYTYEEILNRIENEEILPIHDNLAKDLYKKNVQNDNGEFNSIVNTYQYGPMDKKTGFVQIFPSSEHIGKKGFLFIWAQD